MIRNFQDEEIFKQAQMAAIDAFDKHELVFWDASQVQFTAPDTLLTQLVATLREYVQSPRTCSFWDFVVVSASSRKVTQLAKNCYTFLYSWVRAAAAYREARVVMCLTVHPSNTRHAHTLVKQALIGFYLKCRKVFTAFYNPPVRSELPKLDNQFITMGKSSSLQSRRFERHRVQEALPGQPRAVGQSALREVPDAAPAVASRQEGLVSGVTYHSP